ncbi:MAG: threonine ammonia-lyase [Alphaproteobacteria bacterium]|nr:threonine ammonia-lyase [Alphaproteobacteria bacterium]
MTTIDDIRAARAAIAGEVARTPLVTSRTLSEIAGADIRLKLENLQYTASFKERGALNRLLALGPEERKRGVIAVSAGNHAQAVAYHATRLGIAATVVMPAVTPFIKVANTERLGARVVLEGDTLAEAAAHADALAAAERPVFVHPYDDPLVIAGQGTVALEMLEDAPDLDVLVVPVGGGGLVAGCAIAARAMKPGIEIVGVEAALYPSMRQALAGEEPHVHGETIAEGIAVKTPGTLTRAIVSDLVADILLVSEAEIERAVHLTAEIEKLVVEGAGAAPLAAVLTNPARFAGLRCGLVVSGGNIDSRLLSSVLMRGLVRDGRLVRIRVEVSDRPGQLSAVTALIGELGGNIVDVHHDRWYRDIPVKMTGIDFVVEIRDDSAAQRIVDGLAGHGFDARRLSSDADG